ncbi:MAG: queuosine precursor transporter [Chloroflexota bacterium]|nr:queuosine precursor transporter [Chloroflexota bacterium]
MRVTPLLAVIVALFVTVLITANIVAVKLIGIAGAILPAAVVVFPVSYILADVLTEVYGYSTARAVIWLAFICNALAVLFFWVAGALPSAPVWDGQSAYQRILGYTPRLLGASFAGYLVGEFANAFLLSRMKVATRGRWLWTRTIGSTIIGEGLDTIIFIGLAFAGTMPGNVLGRLMLNQWLAKVVFETLATPFTYAAVRYLKRVEGLDSYDRQVSFNPLAVFGRRSAVRG